MVWALVGIVALVMAGAACGDDDDGATPRATETTTTPAGNDRESTSAPGGDEDGSDPDGDDDGGGDGGGDGPGSDTSEGVDLCTLFATDELADYAARATDADHEVFEVLPGVSTVRPGGGVECRWVVVMGLRDPGSVLVFPDAQCNEDWSRCERDLWMSSQSYPLDEVFEEEWDTGGTASEVPGFEGRSRIAPAQGSLWFDDDETRTALILGLGSVADLDGSPGVVAELLAALAERYVAAS